MPEPAGSAFQYALLRVVPRVERGECLNAGVVLFARTAGFLAARISLDEDRLRALDREADTAAIRAHLDTLARVAAGDPDAGAIAGLPASERFGWLVGPSSTMVQASAVHTGVCEDPAQMIERLFSRLVL